MTRTSTRTLNAVAIVPDDDSPEPVTKVNECIRNARETQKLLHNSYVELPELMLTLALVAAKLTSLANDTLMQ